MGFPKLAKYTDLKNKDVSELRQMEKDLRVKLGKLRFELANKTLKNFNQLKQTKKDIARVLTAINEK
jgi:large subunit ribosomal protein L29